MMSSDRGENQKKSILPEDEFLLFVQEYTQDLLIQCRIARTKGNNGKIFNRRFLCTLVANVRVLEDFLDDHGAKHNSTWFYFRELVATARGFGQTGYLVASIHKRYPPDSLDSQNFALFYKKMHNVQEYLTRVLAFIFDKIEHSALDLGIKFPEDNLDISEEPNLIDYIPLPVTLTLGQSCVENDGKDIARICSLYQNFVQEFDSIGNISDTMEAKEIQQIIPEIINEESIRELELKMHNLESVYDTYIQYRFREDKDPRLADLRKLISIPLILLETARAWSHFYERHRKIHDEIHTAIVGECVLKCIINWALYYCKQFVSCGKNLAEGILADYTAKGTIELNIPQKMGFHLRPATLVAKVVNHYGSEVHMYVGGDRFDASSVLSITWAGGKIARDNIEKVTFVGDKRALRDLQILASVNYGEDLIGKDRPLPKELSYLR